MDNAQLLSIGGPILIVLMVVALIIGISIFEKADHADQEAESEA